MGHRKCEICGVQENNTVAKLLFARFPLDKQRCAEWLKAVGKEDLAYLPIEKLHDLRHICEVHFRKRDFTKTGKRLKQRAIPTLHLSPVMQLSDDVISEFLNLNSHVVTLAEVRRSHVVSTQHENYAIPSTSTSEVPTVGQDLPTTTTTILNKETVVTLAEVRRSHVVSTQHENYAIPSTSTSEVPTVGQDLPTTTTTILNKETEPVPVTHKKKKPLGISNENNMKDPSTSRQASSTESQQRKLLKTDLTDREIKIINELKKTKSSIRSIKRSARLIESIRSPILKEMVLMALKNQNRKPRGRRWTTKYKLSLLAIFKRSPKAYNYLKHLMPLPSVGTITNILKKIPMEPGICQHVMEQIKKQCPKNAQEKLCCLLFDEIAIKPRLIYNTASDKVEGFTDLGDGERSPVLADHALVFMVQGLKKKFKQPIAFYFVKGSISSQKLASLVKENIKKIQETGYRVIATVCDQGPTNMGAIKILTEFSLPQGGTRNNCFTVGDKPIYIVYDVPHLFKSVRNNFLNYGTITIDGKIGKWEHLLKVEEQNRNLLYLSKISQIHVQPKYRAKMKVKYAAQILSNTVAAVLKLISLAEPDPVQANELMNTALVVQTLDKLFDYTNGPSGPNDIKRGLRQNVSQKTDHIKVWYELKKQVESITFVNRTSGIKAKNVRCIKGFLVTLTSFLDIWAECQRLGFQYLNLRQLNQDGLENLFGIIRQHSPTNKNPTASSFVAAIKTAVVTKLTAPHSRGANCMKDSNKILLDFHEILFSESEDNECQKENQNFNISELESPVDMTEELSFPVLNIPDEVEDQKNAENLNMHTVAYLSGYIAYRTLKNHKCLQCHKTLIINPEDATSSLYQYIKLREWWDDKSSLTYPSNNLCNFVESFMHTFETEMLQTLHILNVRLASITLFLANSVTIPNLGCSDHQQIVTNDIMKDLATILIRRQCNRINKNKALEEENLSDKIKRVEQIGA